MALCVGSADLEGVDKLLRLVDVAGFEGQQHTRAASLRLLQRELFCLRAHGVSGQLMLHVMHIVAC